VISQSPQHFISTIIVQLQYHYISDYVLI